MSADSSSVNVAVRVRPLVASELAKGCRDILDVIKENEQIVIKRIDNDNMFTFNYVMASDSSQSEFYARCIQPLIGNLFKGYNVTIFAYGQTGSGKTHTMGTAYSADQDEGVIPRAVKEIFDFKKDNFCYEFSITVSFMELYQETLYDLLSDKDREQTTLEMREDPKRGIHIPGLTEIPVSSVREILESLGRGSQSRVTGATAMNAHSSRSHAIFIINIYMNHKTDSRENKQAKLNLVDLAGSERPKKTGAVGTTLKEGININRGLLALGNVISALGDEKQQKSFIPYRDSNLTRLLKDSLGGNSITLMIACVSPADYNLDETLSTLRYADRAKKIKNKPVINQDAKVAEINELKKTIQQLRLQILGQGGPVVCQAEIELLQKEILDMKAKLKDMTMKLSSALMDNTYLHERIILMQAINEGLNKKIAALKDQCNMTFENINLGISNNDTIMVKDNVSKLQQIYNDFIQIDQEQRETEEEIRFQERAFNDNLNSEPDSIIQNGPTSKEIEQQQVHHTNRQVELNEKLKAIQKELVIKEGLAKSLATNNRTIVDISELNENQEKIAALEREKDELIQKLKTAGSNTGGASDMHRKRIQELEHQLTNLNRKVKEQAKLIEHKAKTEERVKSLNRDILHMKQERVKLIRSMREETDKFKQWRLQKEKECYRLKLQERKKDNEIVKMKIMHSKQQVVFKRRVEQAEALNKRLKNALALRKQVADTKKSENADKIEPWLKQEYELFVDTVAADSTLKMLLNDRAMLKQQLDEMKMDSEKATEEAIKSVEEDIEIRSVQIQDLQTKILDADEENRSKTRFDKIQSMSEAKYALKFLFTQIEKKEQEKVQIESKLNDVQETNREYMEKLQQSEETIRFLEKSSKDQLIEQQKEYEEHIALLLTNDKNAMAAASEEGGVIARMVKLQKELEAREDRIKELEEENRRLSRPKLKSNLTVSFEKPVSKKEVIDSTFIVESNPLATPLRTAEISITDDVENDPDWRKTPLGKRVTEAKRRRKETSLNERPAKVSSGGGCSCKTTCTGRCGCRKLLKSCSASCKCSGELCENRDSENVDPSTSNSESVDEMILDNDDVIPIKRKKKAKKLFSISID